ncbi:MAG: hypothetical protein J6J59_05830, partial [Peptococcaceae bacterium]|nr:hypothetical protein [Peptococcaceae bacterium]
SCINHVAFLELCIKFFHSTQKTFSGVCAVAELFTAFAHIAAYFSKSRQSALVPVDYTLKRYVHKPNGAKPGRVIYENQKTIYITPDEDAILQILADGGVKPEQVEAISAE